MKTAFLFGTLILFSMFMEDHMATAKICGLVRPPPCQLTSVLSLLRASFHNQAVFFRSCTIQYHSLLLSTSRSQISCERNKRSARISPPKALGTKSFFTLRKGESFSYLKSDLVCLFFCLLSLFYCFLLFHLL